ncbi:uncharacterized protein BDV14DRAFT_123238 [Aspergillus stella-maris]|uniref:uncharacterized protein n=1 Tax=Aspergillus stella-maris TaxID=1810926 RepID=UPI003CCD29A2
MLRDLTILAVLGLVGAGWKRSCFSVLNTLTDIECIVLCCLSGNIGFIRWKVEDCVTCISPRARDITRMDSVNPSGYKTRIISI